MLLFISLLVHTRRGLGVCVADYNGPLAPCKHHHPATSKPMRRKAPTYSSGYIHDITDAVMLVAAVNSGILPLVDNRMKAVNIMHLIISGNVFVFDGTSHRWTDGHQWTPSRMNGHFLMYREKFGRRKKPRARGKVSMTRTGRAKAKVNHLPGSQDLDLSCQDLDMSHEDLVPHGLIKKTVPVESDGKQYRVVSYYQPEELEAGKLMRPTQDPWLLDALDGIDSSRMLLEEYLGEAGVVPETTNLSTPSRPQSVAGLGISTGLASEQQSTQSKTIASRYPSTGMAPTTALNMAPNTGSNTGSNTSSGITSEQLYSMLDIAKLLNSPQITGLPTPPTSIPFSPHFSAMPYYGLGGLQYPGSSQFPASVLYPHQFNSPSPWPAHQAPSFRSPSSAMQSPWWMYTPNEGSPKYFPKKK